MTFGEWFRVGRLLAVAPAVMGIAALACGGAQQAKAPGGGNSLETGAVAVEPDESHVWIMTESQTETPLGAQFSSSLVAVDATTGSAQNALDVTHETDRQILFPASHRALYVGYEDGSSGTHAVLLDTTTLLPLADSSLPGQLSGLRPSSSGGFALGVDRSGYTPRERILDTGALLAADFPGQGGSVESMSSWNHHSDRLISATSAPTGPDGQTTIAARTITHGAGGPQFGAAEIQATIAGQIASGSCFDVTPCIGVSPDDGIAVIPFYTQSTSALAVLDETTGAVRTVRGSGPVGFTPDSSTIIAYDWSNDGSTVSLELIDRATLAIHPAALPTRENPAFFVTETGSEVVLTSMLGGGPITVLDTATGEMTQVTNPGISLEFDEFVERPGRQQLWILNEGTLSVLKLSPPSPSLEPVALPFYVNHLNILPAADSLVLVPNAYEVTFYSMASRTIDLTAPLPPPG